MTQSEYGSRIRALITGTGRYVPDDVWTSDMVEARVDERSGGWRIPKGIIRLATGVGERRYAPDGMCSSDLAARAAERALATAGIEPRDVDLLIFASASHDVAEPATANMVQIALGCDRAAVMDVKNACNSFLNGLDVAQAFIETGRAPRVVVAAGECLSPTIKWDIGGSDDLPIRLRRAHVGRCRRGLRPRGERRSGARRRCAARSSRTVATGSSRPCSAAAPATARRPNGCSSSAGARSCSSSP